MSKKNFKNLLMIITPILILSLMTSFSLKNLPEKIYLNESTETATISLPKTNVLTKMKITTKDLNINLLGLVNLKTIPVEKIKSMEVYPGGSPVGIKLSTEGVLVVGFSEVNIQGEKVESPAKLAGIELGDIIKKVNNEDVTNSKEVGKKIIESEKEVIFLEMVRKGETIQREFKAIKEDGENRIGLWVRDSTAGIGTLTFYDKNSKAFGALGHPITDGDTNTIFKIKAGDLINSSVISVRKGEKGMPGELRGVFINDKDSIGSINKNTISGIYGETTVPIINNIYTKPIEVGFRCEVKEGPAKIITTIDENGPKEYNIEIVKTLEQDKPGPKSMVIKVTDPELLEKTGGIVQGMSGSPIIQNDKLVGAITHVLINKPEIGYGIYIEWMLEDAGILD